MDENQLKRLLSSGRFISGVHNYCDRWCERCPLASRCIVRATELEDAQADGGAELDAAQERFWKKLAENFAVTRRMIDKHCKEMGIEISAADLEAAGREERRREIKVRRSSLSKFAMQYAKLVEKWFKRKPQLMEEKQKMLESIAAMGLPGHDPAADAEQIVDAIEVVRWYELFIGVKTARAVGGLVDIEEEGGDEDEIHQSDANGTAKIALIAVDRSIAAWSLLRDHFPEEGDRVLDLLVHLDRLRNQLEQTFPNARKFKRPGFDDPQIAVKENTPSDARSPNGLATKRHRKHKK